MSTQQQRSYKTSNLKENRNENVQSSPREVAIPGVIDDEKASSPFSKQQAKSSPFKAASSTSNLSPPGIVRTNRSGASPGIPPIPQRSPVEDTTSSRASARSVEHQSTDTTPQSAKGYCPVSGAPMLDPRPIMAPSGAPCGPEAGRDYSVCGRTGTVIPALPPMPSASLRNSGRCEAESPPRPAPLPLPTGPRPVATSSSRSASLPRRPQSAQSAAAASAFSQFTSSSAREKPRRKSDGAAKELCYPPHVCSAVRHGRYEDVEAALCAGFPPNYADEYGNTLFHIACQNGKRRVAKLVIKYGCNANAQNLRGHTGLHFLFAYGYAEMAEYFISKGADEYIKNSLGNATRAGIK